MCTGEDEDCLVGIGQQNLLVLALGSRVEPDDGLFPFLDFFDHPRAILLHRDTDPVTNGRQVARAWALFQPPAQLANEGALPGLYGEETRLGPDDQTSERGFGHRLQLCSYGFGVLVGIPPIGVGVLATP